MWFLKYSSTGSVPHPACFVHKYLKRCTHLRFGMTGFFYDEDCSFIWKVTIKSHSTNASYVKCCSLLAEDDKPLIHHHQRILALTVLCLWAKKKKKNRSTLKVVLD